MLSLLGWFSKEYTTTRGDKMGVRSVIITHMYSR